MDDDIKILYKELYDLYGDVNKLYKLNDSVNDKVIDILKGKTDNFTEIKDKVKNLESRFYTLADWSRKIDSKINDNFYVNNLNDKCEYLEKEIEELKAEKEDISSNNYVNFGIAASTFIALFVSAICCGISCSNRVKVEETPTEMRINLDNPQNKDIQLDINHG